MTNTTIKIESVSKLYRLGTVGTGTMAHDLIRYLTNKRPWSLVNKHPRFDLRFNLRFD